MMVKGGDRTPVGLARSGVGRWRKRTLDDQEAERGSLDGPSPPLHWEPSTPGNGPRGPVADGTLWSLPGLCRISAAVSSSPPTLVSLVKAV
jgi:hypothetical protein